MRDLQEKIQQQKAEYEKKIEEQMKEHESRGKEVDADRDAQQAKAREKY